MKKLFLKFFLFGLPVMALAACLLFFSFGPGFDKAKFELSAALFLDQMARVRDRSGPQSSESILANLPQSPVNGPCFRFDTRLDQARILGEKSKAGTKQENNFSGFEFEDGLHPGFAFYSDRTAPMVENGCLALNARGDDYLVSTRPTGLDRASVGSIRTRLRAENGKKLRLGWKKAGDTDPDPWSNMLDMDIVDDGRFHTYELDAGKILQKGLLPEDKLESLFLRTAFNRKAQVEIDYIRFLPWEAFYHPRAPGADYVNKSGEMRPALFLCPGQGLEYTLTLPENRPVLEFGAAALKASPVQLTLSLAYQGKEKILFNENLAQAHAWEDHALSLDKWAGKTVTVRFRVNAKTPNVGFFSNPLIRSPRKKKHNIILVIEDALRPDHLSVYGYARPTTPFKKRLMEESGLVFTQAVSQASTTRPSLPSLMTGLLPTACGMYSFGDRLSDSYLTLAEILREQGFVTAAFIQNGNAGPGAGLHQGFSHLFDSETLSRKPENILGDPVREWIEKNKDRNFFLFLHVLDPHGPYDPPEAFRRWYEQIQESGKGKPVAPDPFIDPPWLKQPTDEARKALYDGEAAYNDHLLASFMLHLKTLDLDRDSLLIFTADHGEFLGEHGLWGHNPPGYAQGVRVPLLMNCPREFPKDRTINQKVQLMDLAPTILEFSGLDPDQFSFHGKSLVGLIRGDNPRFWETRLCVSEEPVLLNRVRDAPFLCGSLFYENFHLLNSPRLKPRGWNQLRSSLRLQAFDWEKDPGETGFFRAFVKGFHSRNTINPVMKAIQDLAVETRQKYRSSGAVGETSLDPNDLENLRSIGYMQ